MAVCSLNLITITGADGFPTANGIYTKQGSNVYENAEGVLFMHAMGGDFGPGWYIISSGNKYFAAQLPANCPTGLTFYGVNGIEGSFTLIDCADPLERCAFAVPGESGRSRFRRLVALGYV